MFMPYLGGYVPLPEGYPNHKEKQVGEFKVGNRVEILPDKYYANLYGPGTVVRMDPGALVLIVYFDNGMRGAFDLHALQHLKTNPTMTLSENTQVRKGTPIGTGVLPMAAWWPAQLKEERKAMIMSEDAKTRKNTPIGTGVLDYFPRALAAVAQCSKAGNDQHNPGQPLHWDKTKSTDHVDCIARHLIDRETVDTDGIPHAAKLAWRALAFLEMQLEAKEKK